MSQDLRVNNFMELVTLLTSFHRCWEVISGPQAQAASSFTRKSEMLCQHLSAPPFISLVQKYLIERQKLVLHLSKAH